MNHQIVALFPNNSRILQSIKFPKLFLYVACFANSYVKEKNMTILAITIYIYIVGNY